MSRGKLLLYAVVALVTLVVVGVVVNAVLTVLALIWQLAFVLTLLVVFGSLGYVGYKLYGVVSDLFSDESADAGAMTDIDEFSLDTDTSRSTVRDSTVTDDTTQIDELRQQYMNGEITEEEFERRLERELDTDEYDDIDRELQRERN